METLQLPQYIQPKEDLSKQSLKPQNPQTSLANSINSLFPTQAEEDKVARMRKHLGEFAKTLSNEQVETIIAEFQFLIDTWLDEYEKEVFNGLTLKEVLNGG